MSSILPAGQGWVSLPLLLAGTLLAATAPPAHARDQLTPVLARVLAAPAGVPLADGSWVLPYELELTNVTSVPQTIESLQVRDPSGAATSLLSLSGTGVSDNLLLPGARGTTVLGPGQSAVLLVTPAFPSRAWLPQRLVHRLVVRNGGGVPDQPAPDRGGGGTGRRRSPGTDRAGAASAG